MPEADAPPTQDLTALTVQLLSAYVANNRVDHGELAGLIQSTRAALEGPSPEPLAEPEPEPEFKRAVTVKKSLADPERIISMIDGKAYRTLTRHLAKHGLSAAEYRARYKLPTDYPTIAPGYSEQRRQVARDRGLGRKPATPPAASEAAGDTDAVTPAAASAPPAVATRRGKATAGTAATGQRGRGRTKGAEVAASAPAEPKGEAAPAPRRRRRGGNATEPSPTA